MNLSGLQIVINCMGMPFDGYTIQGKSLGGSESAAYYVALQLALRGNDVKIFTNTNKQTDHHFLNGSLSFIPAGRTSEECPLGADFQFYAQNTPHDLLIIQRHKGGFTVPYAAKLKFLWLHDLAMHRDTKALYQSALNIDGILVVSEYHKDQVCRIHDIPSDFVHVFKNGVDPESVAKAEFKDLGVISPKGKNMIYISRPERGLDNLLVPGGIMDQLPDHQLYVCTYNNVTSQMAPYYEQLWRRIEEMPNVHNLGFLTKEELYSYMKSMDLMVYPTPSPSAPNFREVSCIAAMEAMHCGLPVVTSAQGSLPETLAGAGAVFCAIDEMADIIRGLTDDELSDLEDKQLHKAMFHTWESSVNDLDEIIGDLIYNSKSSDEALIQHQIRHSAISKLFTPGEYQLFSDNYKEGTLGLTPNTIRSSQAAEITECYEFYPLDSYAKHYEEYYQYEADRGVDYGPENLVGNSRFETVVQHIIDADLSADAWIMDYGCAHGHYTINLSKIFPQYNFVGVDIAASNVMKARQWALEEEISNVEFINAEVDCDSGQLKALNDDQNTYAVGDFDLVICAEVLEHVRDPHLVAQSLMSYVADRGYMVITTPFGPWEAQGYQQHWPWRAHIHDFTCSAIKTMYGNFESLNISCVPSGMTERNEPIGSYVYSFRVDNTKQIGDINTVDNTYYLDKHSAEQTLSLCMIIKDDWVNLAKCLDSCKGVVDQLVVGFDKTGNNETAKSLVEGFSVQNRVPVKIMAIESPMDVGFSRARNVVISEADGDWVLWLDSDEQLVNPERLRKYLHHNMYDAYSIKQDHMSLDPMGVIKTDFPSKLFRSTAGIEFYGLVHEHPEKGLNQGVGPVAILPDVSIVHYGYDDEIVRRNRFARNFDLLKKDREIYPDRTLGKFFWLRDMAQFCQFKMEQGEKQSVYAEAMEEGFKIWPEVLETGNLRMILESAKFYTMLVRASGNPGIIVSQNMALATSSGEMERDFECLFRDHDEALEYLSLVNKLNVESMPLEEV